MGNALCKSVPVLKGTLRGTGGEEDVRAVDLLLVLTKAAATSSRSKTILGPFPEPCAKKFGGNDYAKAADVATRMTRARSLMTSGPLLVENEAHTPDHASAETKEGDAATVSPTAVAVTPTTVVEKEKDEKDKALVVSTSAVPRARKTSFDVAKWAVKEAPAKIFPLEGGLRFANMKTPYQFLLKHKNASSREAKFRKARNSGQTTLAFHGSRIENWHSIFHNGLMVCSGKSGLQLNGAAYGSGIYVSQNSSTSMGYCGQNWKYNGVSNPQSGAHYKTSHTLLSDDATSGIRVLALCEIMGSIKKSEANIWVVPRADQIVVRALFVFTASNSPPSVTAGHLQSNLRKAAKKYNV